MDKVSYNKIPNLETPWESKDPTNDLWWSGLSTEDVIKRHINMKIGASYFDSTTMSLYQFSSEEDKLAWIGGDTSVEKKVCPFEFSGTVNRMTVLNNMDSKNLYYTQMSEGAVITVGFKSEEKGITDTSWNEVMEDARMTVEVDRGLTGKYNTVVNEQLVLNGDTFSVDVIKYLATGNNRVRITAVGVDTGATSNIVYSALLTSMYLSPANFKWETPFIEGQAFSLGGLYIGGNIDKVLKIKVSNEQTYSKLYEINIGTQTNTSIAYYYNGLEFPTEGTGVYNIEMWLDANGLESEHLHYNIMCIATTDVKTAQLIAVSNVLSTVKNYDTNKLFSYAVYNGGAQSASPIINVSAIINNIPTVIVKDAILKDIATATALDYIIDLEVDTQEANIQLYSSIELGESKQEAVYAIDNSASFPAVKNAVFYFNPANRDNSQENKTTIVNESNLSGTETTYNATWTNVSFVDGMDGWTVDNQGRKCLRLPATSKVSIDYAPFLNQNTLTLDISYRVENAADYNEDVITIASELTSKFIGVRVKPTNVLLHSNALNDNDLMQGYNTKDEEFVHLIVTIIQNYKGIGNLAQIYVNGVKKCSFEWVAGDTFSHGGTIDLGSDTADLFIYKMYVYHEAFDWIMSAQNFTASLPDTASKKAAHAKMQSVINDGNKIDFDKVKNGGYNYFTLRLPDGAKLPSTLSQSSVPHTRLEINIQQNPLFAINGIYDDEETEGQGTTAMNYFRWNLRWKTEIIRITAKKNFASSMHSHKMGATALFNDLNRMIVGANEADARVAVEQYGAYGFLEVLKEGTTDQYERIFIGLYTIGQDKGDKTTFGYNNPTYKDTVIHLEGTDHSPRAVGMDYPWAKLGVATNSDGDTNLGVRNADGSVVAAWEIGACGKAKTDADMLTYLTQEFKPAYELDYLNTAMLVGLEAGITIDTVNANLSAFRAIETDLGYTNADCLIWIDGEYDTYYYDELEKKYVKDGVNLLTDLGISASDLTGTNVHEKNLEIRALRKARYREQMENVWHLRDNLFHYCFIVLFAATDNFKKNTYPYKFGTLASGSRWRWRQDDLDTLFDINNQGLANKIYSLLNGDKSGTTHLFRGNTSYHWTNIQFYYENEIKSMMLEILTAMASMSDTGDSLIEKAVGCIRKYFWNKAQDYFSKSAYNLDAEWSYEEAWAAMKNGTYKAPVHPLQQSLGSHYEAERAFVELRFVFMASLYGFGAFGVGNDSDTSLGQISFRPAQGDNTFHLTPAINMNPTILVGDSDRKTADGRLLAGETAEITVSTDGDTSIYIQGTDYLSDIGDFSKVNLYAENPALTVQSKRLQKLKVGDEVADNVTTILKDLSILACPSLSEVDARNVSTLTGTVDLSQCPRLKKALFGGTNVGIISLQKGSKIEEFELPDSLTNLSLVNLPNLDVDGLKYGDLTALTYLRVEGNANLNGYGLLKATYEDGSPLTNIRVVGFDYDGTANDVALLAKLASGGYFGIDSNGAVNYNIIPVIEGTLNIASSVYEDDANAVRSAYGTNLVLNITGGYYMRFADPEVLKVLLANGVGDGTGITEEQAAKVTNISLWFQNNTTIETFNELEKFTGVTSFEGHGPYGRGAFLGCSNLKSITIPNGVKKFGVNMFRGCSSLQNVKFPKTITNVNWSTFRDCSNLNIEFDAPELTGVSVGSFYNSGFTKINFGKVSTIPDVGGAQGGVCQNCAKLEEVRFSSAITYIGQWAFGDCAKLATVIIEALTPPKLSSPYFNGTCIFYVPNNSIDTYKTASDWSGYASRIKGMDFGIKIPFPEINGKSFNVELIPGLNNITNVVWSISAGNDFAEIDQTGFVTIKESANESVVTVRCESAEDNSIFVEENITVTYLEGIVFEDPAVEAICLAKWDIDGGNVISEEEAAQITDIGTTFKGNTAITSFDEFEKFTGVTSLAVGAYLNCTSLSSIKVPNGVTAFNQDSFKGCSALTSFTTDWSKIVSIGMSAFQNCTALEIEDFQAPNLETLGQNAFYNCTALEFEDLSLPNLTSLGQNAFYGVKIKKISNLGKITTLPTADSSTQNFGDKSVLEEIVLPEGVTNLNEYAFYGYKAMKEIILPSGLSSLSGRNIFSGCSSLSFDAAHLPKSITYVGYGALSGFTGLYGELSLPNLTGIGEMAFKNTKITKILNLGKIESTVEGDGNGGTFGNCTSLQHVELPETLRALNRAFLFNCPNIKTMIIRAITPPSFNTSQNSVGAVIYVPDGSVEQEVDNGDGTTSTVTKTIVELYKEASGWSDYADRIRPMSEYDVRILTYNEDGNGGYKLYQIVSYDTAKNDYVMGVAVKYDNFYCVISPTNNAATYWGPLYRNIPDGNNGREWTNNFLAQYPSDTNNYAFNLCDKYVFADGRASGYLGSKGEWKLLVARKNVIDFAMTTIGGDAFSETSWIAGESSSNESDYGTYLTWSTGSFANQSKTARNYASRTLIELPEGLEW